MKKIKIVLIATMLVFTACNNNNKSITPSNNFIDFKVTPEIDTVKPLESVNFYAYLNDTLTTGTGLQNKNIVWQILTGGGKIQKNGNNSAVYTADSNASNDFVTAVINVFPEMDMRYNKLVYIYVKPGTTPPPPDTGICFTRDILPIFNSNCALSGCHNGSTTKEGYNLTSYQTITAHGITPGNPSRSKLYTVLLSGGEERMPRGRSPLTQDEINLIYKWIAEGAKNTDCSGTPPTGCDTVNVTFSGTIQKIINTNCLGCHSGNPPQGNVDLSTYANIKIRVDNGSLYAAITHTGSYVPMPNNNIFLPSCSLNQMLKWIANGAPNN